MRRQPLASVAVQAAVTTFHYGIATLAAAAIKEGEID
jgi:hypothetical protein